MPIRINSKEIKVKDVVNLMDYMDLIGIKYDLVFELKDFKEHD